MEYIKTCLYAIIPMAIICIIINNAIPSSNYAKRAFVFTLVLVGLILLFGGGVIFDYYYFGQRQFRHYQYYLAGGSIVLMVLGFIIYNLVKAKKYNHHLGKASSRSEKDVAQFLYIVYRYGGMYYINKEEKNGQSLYSATVVPFNRGCFFYDDMFNKYIKENDVKVLDYNLIGTATIYQKKKMIFYCMMVDITSCDITNELEAISPYEIYKLEMLDFHKTLIMRILIGEQFNIEL